MFLTAPRADAESSSDRSPFGNFYFEPVGMRTSAGVRVTPSSAMGLPLVWDCINVLAKSFAMMPFCLTQPPRDGNGSKLKRRDHWMWKLIAKAPNSFQTPFEFRMMLQGHLALRGNAFCQITEDRQGRIIDLLPLHPDRMQAEVLPSGNYRYVYTDQNGRQIRYLRSEIWHLRWLSDDGIVGMAPIEVAREALGEALAMQTFASRFYANDGRPGGWIEFDGSFKTEGARDTFKESWQKSYSGKNLRKVAVLERGMKYHELGLKLADQEFVEARKDRAYEIPRIWGIPPHKVGVLDKATFSNIEQQNIEFWTDTMMPWGKMWSDSIEFFLLGPDSGLDAEFDAKPMMRGDGKARSDRIRSLVLSGVMLRNEGREEEGYDPVDGLDVPLVPVNMATVGPDGEIELPEPPEVDPMDGTDPDDTGGGSPAKPGAPDDGSGENLDASARVAQSDRLQRMVHAAAGRLARRAAGALAKKTAAEVFDADFTAVVAETLGIDDELAAAWGTSMAESNDIDEALILGSLLAVANGE